MCAHQHFNTSKFTNINISKMQNWQVKHLDFQKFNMWFEALIVQRNNKNPLYVHIRSVPFLHKSLHTLLYARTRDCFFRCLFSINRYVSLYPPVHEILSLFFTKIVLYSFYTRVHDISSFFFCINRYIPLHGAGSRPRVREISGNYIFFQ